MTKEERKAFSELIAKQKKQRSLAKGKLSGTSKPKAAAEKSKRTTKPQTK